MCVCFFVSVFWCVYLFVLVLGFFLYFFLSFFFFFFFLGGGGVRGLFVFVYLFFVFAFYSCLYEINYMK